MIQLTGHVDKNGLIEIAGHVDLPPGDVVITIAPIGVADEALAETVHAIRAEWTTAFVAAREEHFESGMESEFSRNLLALIARHGTMAVTSLLEFTRGSETFSEAASEALRWLGKIHDPETEAIRFWVLQHCLLNSPHSNVRDGAVLGLASMDNPGAIPNVERAFEAESNPLVRAGIKQLLDQLDSTARVIAKT